MGLSDPPDPDPPGPDCGVPGAGRPRLLTSSSPSSATCWSDEYRGGHQQYDEYRRGHHQHNKYRGGHDKWGADEIGQCVAATIKNLEMM